MITKFFSRSAPPSCSGRAVFTAVMHWRLLRLENRLPREGRWHANLQVVKRRA
ncbi:hypothetical protein M404DRAFT_813605 [Pisolithus tinctorius Marx 270]|uniref:Uncharacterized protein n=1 Tax=Pisolithus tinctorius Marx 270 TaxID=870435 RepID=A0A0C3IR65_PISTI|nr:hypothetical protein M404DRAFT_813605 [Pisolithus tinctorius Marx 270]